MSEAVPMGRSQERGDLVKHLLAALALAVLLALVFGDVLVGSGLEIPSHAQGDTARFFVFMRLFGYSELGAGNVPLWNPHTFSGMPFVGNFQSAIFYPPNLVHLLTGVRLGVTLEFVISLFVLGMSVFIWLRAKGLHAVSAFVAAVAVMFGSTVTLRVLAGQLSVLETFAWWPLLLRAIDGLERRFSLGWLLVGILAAALMLLAGHPPTVLQAAVATGLYTLPTVIRSDRRGRLLASFVPLVIAPPLLAAVQLFEGLGTASEGLRQAGMSYAFATSHSFPPEQLLTLFSPDLFGNADRFNLTYFGRVFYWDATYFVGLFGLLLAVHGALGGQRPDRNRALGLCVFLAVVAMGSYTPLYKLFFIFVPGFDYMRAPSKFLFFSSVFLAWLIALGLERMLETREGLGRTAVVAGGFAAGAAGLLVWTLFSPVSLVQGGGPMAMLTRLTRASDFVVEGVAADWYDRLVLGAGIACATAILAAGTLWLAARDRRFATVFVGLTVLELLIFARIGRGTTRMTIELDLRPQVVEAYAMAGRTRVHETAAPSNIAMARRNYGIWGYDPVVLRRYIEFMSWSQGMDWRNIRRPTRFVPYHHHPLHEMLRVRYQIDWKTKELIEHTGALPRFVFLDEYRIVSPDEVLDALGQPDFDPRRSVILEEEPDPAPTKAPRTEVPPRLWLIGESTDYIDLEVDLDRPLVLLLTEAYSRGWRARALSGSDQDEYSVLPANYVLRAVPLGAGHHRFRVEYAPLAFRMGLWVSCLSGMIYLGVLIVWGLGYRRRSSSQHQRA